MWRVDPIGPLSKSGGVSELARINSNEVSAFSDVAWIPTLLPSTTLGSISNSPSACFVASDGHCLRVYQAVIDARALLAELNQAARKGANRNGSLLSLSSGADSNVEDLRGGSVHADNLKERFHVVSTQSTAKPGAIIQLEAISDATQNWQSTLMLHAFQEQLILSEASIPSGQRRSGLSTAHPSGFITSRMSAVVDLDQHQGGFREPFYTLVAEKADSGVLMHMWRLVISSGGAEGDAEGDATSGSITPDATGQQQQHITRLLRQQQSHLQHHELHVSTEKVCVQKLPLPDGVEVIHAVSAVGHLSSSSIYPACLAPYVMVTACSDGFIRYNGVYSQYSQCSPCHTYCNIVISSLRFWRVKMVNNEGEVADAAAVPSFEWEEWQMESVHGDSSIKINGRPVSVSAAYSGRIAVAYQTGASYQKKQTTQEKQG